MKPEERVDLDIAAKLLQSHGLTPKRFTKAERRKGKTPDFRVMRGENLLAFCEVKSPQDDWLDTQLEEATNGEIVGGHRKDPVFNRLSRIVEKATSQFDAVNASRDVPNILILINHDDMSYFGDLRETITGMFHSEDGSRHPTVLPVSEGKIKELRTRIDAYFWYDFEPRRCQLRMLNEFSEHFDAICSMFEIDKSKIVR